MPEGVEVKISTETIKPLLIGKRVINAFGSSKGRYSSENPPGYSDFLKEITDKIVRITEISCKGKFMYWSFDNGWNMFSTFGMTGQWSPTEGKHPCFVFFLGEDAREPFDKMFFNDPRHFGTIKFSNSEQELKKKLNELGWDPLHKDGLTKGWHTWLISELSKCNKPIGQVLLDQSLFAGVGNYIRAEALYATQMSPWKICKDINKQDLEKLCISIIDVMNESYSYQGATLLTYKDAYGNEGKYSSCFKVYGRDADPLGNPIITGTTPEGRTIHWCPNVQK